MIFFVRGKLFNVADLKTFLVGEEAPLNLPQGETFWECKAWSFCVCVVTFQRRRLENDWPPKSPWRGTFRLCGEWDIVWCVANFSTSKTWKRLAPSPSRYPEASGRDKCRGCEDHSVLSISSYNVKISLLHSLSPLQSLSRTCFGRI